MKRIINTAIVYFYICKWREAYFIGNLQNGTDIQSDYIRSAACSSVGDGNIVYFL